MARPSDPQARSRLLNAAQRVFAERGLDRARVEEIAGEAGVSKGAFYLHFASKEEAFREVVTTVISRLESFLSEDCLNQVAAHCSNPMPTEAKAALTAEPLDDWLEGDVAIFEYVWEQRQLVRLVMEGGGSADYRHLVDHFADRVQSHVLSVLRLGVSAGLYRSDLDVHVAAAFLAGGYDRFARRLVREPQKPDLRAVVRELQALVGRGIGSEQLIRKLGNGT
ncbi:MAG TPA: helix-turn-helix domain-containing protein [Polyangiaceae bacterium]|nr:helix-turn-helix domain-containing protein [Polyangiaceae bacterium]